MTRAPAPEGTKVVVVEFSDFNCPACRSASEIAKKIRKIPNLYFEFRHFPLPISGHETSSAAANAFECGRTQGFGEKMEEVLFANLGNLSEELFLKLPEIHNFGESFDSEKFEKCVIENEFGDLVKKDLSFAKRSGLNSTPTFFVNGLKTPRSDLLTTVAAEFENANNADSTQ